MHYDKVEGLAQALFEECEDGLFLFDPETAQVLDVNSAGQRLSGFPLRELLGQPVPDLFRFESKGQAKGGMPGLLHAARKTGVHFSQDGYLLRTVSDGVWVPVHLTVARLHVKPKPLGLITARDMRGQREVEAEARKAEAELQRMLGALPDCVWSAEIDGDGQCVYRYFSPGVEKLTGQTAGYFLEGIQRWWSQVHPDDQARWAKAQVQLRGSKPVEVEYRIVRPDGAVRWLRDRAVVSPGPAGALGPTLRLDGVLTDITERVNARTARSAAP